MNNLNSIILEGETKKDQYYNFVDNEQTTYCRFTMATKRDVQLESGEKIQREYLIPCEAVGNIAKTVNRRIYKTDSQCVCIVGVLKCDVSGVYVFAEHIEYKLGKKSK